MAYLSRDQVREIITKRPPGTTPEGIIAALRESHDLEGYGDEPQLRAMPSLGARLKNRAISEAPSIGGFLGGIGGGLLGGPAAVPAAILGAQIGGTAGEGIRQGLSHERLDTSQMAKQGLTQGAYEALGHGIARGAGQMVKPMIRKTVSFQRAATPSVILNEFGKPFMIEGKAVEFMKRPPKGAHRAAEVAMDMASHTLGPGGALLRPVMRGLRGKVASGASGLGSFVNGKGFQNFARQFPRAAVALKHLATYEDQDSLSGAEPDATKQ